MGGIGCVCVWRHQSVGWEPACACDLCGRYAAGGLPELDASGGQGACLARSGSYSCSSSSSNGHDGAPGTVYTSCGDQQRTLLVDAGAHYGSGYTKRLSASWHAADFRRESTA